MFVIKTEDVYKNFSSDKEIFDLSNYSTNSKCYDNSNKLVVDKMKDETAGVTIKEFLNRNQKCIPIWQMIIVSIKRQRT